MVRPDPKAPTRSQLRNITDDQELIRLLERLFIQAGTLTPTQIEEILALIDEVLLDASIAGSRATAAADSLQQIARELGLLASKPGYEMPRSFPVDYIDFDLLPRYVAKVGRGAWSAADDTLNLHHSGGVVQQVGHELYVRFLNATGATIPNGTAIGVNPLTNQTTTYIANGTLSPLGIVGVTTQDIPSGAMGRVTTFGQVHGLNTTGSPFGEAWTAGALLYVSRTIAGGFTIVKPTAPALSIPIGRVVSVHATDGAIFVRPAPEQQLYYGAFTKLTDQAPSAINTPQALLWTNTESANGVSIGAPASRITVANAGLYKVSLSLQLTASNAAVKNVWSWFRKNGVDVPNSSIITSLDSATAVRAPSRALYFSLAANDYIEVMFASNDIGITVDNIGATAFAPAAPAAILTINQEQQ